jgi:hypothetical protein
MSGHKRKRGRLHASAKRKNVNGFGHSFVGQLLHPKSSQPPFSKVSLGPCRSLPNHVVSAVNPRIASHMPPKDGAL